MYVALLIILLGAAIAIIITGLQKLNLTKIIIGALIAVFTVLFFSLLSFWGEMLWFGALGYSQRFWYVVIVKVSLAFAVHYSVGFLFIS